MLWRGVLCCELAGTMHAVLCEVETCHTQRASGTCSATVTDCTACSVYCFPRCPVCTAVVALAVVYCCCSLHPSSLLCRTRWCCLASLHRVWSSPSSTSCQNGDDALISTSHLINVIWSGCWWWLLGAEEAGETQRAAAAAAAAPVRHGSSNSRQQHASCNSSLNTATHHTPPAVTACCSQCFVCVQQHAP